MACLVGALGVSGSVWAQTDLAMARALFTEGRRLMSEQRYEEACPKFEESLRIDHGMGTQFNLAYCWEKLGRTASAWALFLDVAAAAKAANQPDREAAARQQAEALEARLSRLKISVAQPAPELVVLRDGQPVSKPAWGTPLPIDPGKHQIVAEAPGRKAWSQELQVPTTAQVFSIEVPPLESLHAPVTRDEAPDEAAEPAERVVLDGRAGSGGGQKLASYVVGGAGVVALAAGTVFALRSRSFNDEAGSLCRDTRDPATGQLRCSTPDEEKQQRAAVNDAKQSRLLGFLGFGIGAAGVATAIVLYATADEAPAESAGLQLTPVLGANTWGAELQGRF